MPPELVEKPDRVDAEPLLELGMNAIPLVRTWVRFEGAEQFGSGEPSGNGGHRFLAFACKSSPQPTIASADPKNRSWIDRDDGMKNLDARSRSDADLPV